MMAEGKERLRQELSQCRRHSRTVLRLTPRRLSPTMRAVGRASGAASRACGAIMRSAISVVAVSSPKKRTRRGRLPKGEAPQVEVRYRLVVPPEGEGIRTHGQAGPLFLH